MAFTCFNSPITKRAVKTLDSGANINGAGGEAHSPIKATANASLMASKVVSPSTSTQTGETATAPQAQSRPDYKAIDKAEYDEIEAAEKKKIDAWRQYLNTIPAPESEEDREKREKKERSKKIIGAVSDGIRAMSNLYFTTQYAPDSYNHRNSQLDATTRAIEKAKAERQANLDRYHQFSINIAGAEADKARTMAELRGRQEARQIARDKAERDLDAFNFDKTLRPYREQQEIERANREKNLAIKAGHDADAAGIHAGNADALDQAEIDRRKAGAGASRAAAAASYARANATGRVKHNFLGKEYESDKNYAKEVLKAANAYNAKHKDEAGFEPIITEDMENTGYDKRRKPRSATEIAAEVERRMALDGKGKGYGDSSNRGY